MTKDKAMRDLETAAQTATGKLLRPPLATNIAEIKTALMNGEIDVKYGFEAAMSKSFADGDTCVAKSH